MATKADEKKTESQASPEAPATASNTSENQNVSRGEPERAFFGNVTPEDGNDLPEGAHYVTHGTLNDGAKVGQILPDEDKTGPSEAALKAGDAYRDAREKCPACGLHDGVRKGSTVCDSCGAHIKDANAK